MKSKQKQIVLLHFPYAIFTSPQKDTEMIV